MKRKTGTREWSDASYNIGIGCSHGCLYCYARSQFLKSHPQATDKDWDMETIKTKLPAIKKINGVVMYPTMHDITEPYLNASIDVLQELLTVGNKVLIVSKPHPECITALCEALASWKGQILFRFTIGTPDEETAKFWEPGAPTIAERMKCLMYAYRHGFATSVSMEPMLGTVEETLALFNKMSCCVTDKIWIGKMNKIDQRVAKASPEVMAKCAEVMANQTDDRILWLVDMLKNNPKVAWKDSIKEVMEKHGYEN